MSSSSSSPTSSESPFFTVLVTPTQSNPPSTGPFGSQSTPLYLFTFLATLLVLVIVSSAIVMRSFIIRRRFRREIEQALAAGNLSIIPPTALGIRRRHLGEKPKLWDTHLEGHSRGLRWSYITPVSAKISATLPSGPSSTDDVSKSHQVPPRSPFAGIASLVQHPFAATRRRARGRGRGQDRTHNDHLLLSTLSNSNSNSNSNSTTTTPVVNATLPPSSPSPQDNSNTPLRRTHVREGGGEGEKSNVNETSSPSSDQDPLLLRATEIQVSMLIAMPDPHHHQYRKGSSSFSYATTTKGKDYSLDRDGYWEDPDEGVPDVVFGVTTVPFRNITCDSCSNATVTPSP